MNHPSLQELLEHEDSDDIQAHLAGCGACRARRLMLTVGDPSSLPELDAARRALADARRAASLSVERSWGSDPLARPRALSLLSVGRRLDRYEVQERIGVGAMGAVYRVEHTTLGSSHALKVVHLASEGARSRLIREGQAQGRLQHAGVVPVTDVIDVDGEPGLVMAYVDGPPLSAWLAAHGPPSLDLVGRLGEQILRAVGAAHGAGIVHRDLKPGNVLIASTDQGPAARVCDFGLARSLDDADGHRGPLGTPGYMAPEQIRDAGQADARSDLFAVGAVLYELATGARAFDGPDIVEVWRRIGEGAYDPPRRLRPELPDAMARTIERALSVDPAHRFPDAAAMLAAWQAATAAPPPPARAPLWAVAVVGVLAVAAVALGALELSTAGPASAGVAAPAAQGTDAADRRLTAVGEAYQIFTIALSDDDQQLLFADSRGLWLQEVDDGTPRRVFGGGPIHSVDWLGPHEALVSMAGVSSGTFRVDLPTGALTQVSSRKASFARVLPNGTEAVLPTDDGLFLLELETGEERLVRSMEAGEYPGAVALSPDGRHLAAVFLRGERRTPWLERIELASGTSTVLHESMGLVSLGMAAVEWVAPDRLLFAENRGRTGASLHALDHASTAPDASAATKLRSWEGYQLIRLRSGGAGLVASRGTARQDVMGLRPGHSLELMTPEAWHERPVGWTSEGLLMVSDRGGGGLYALREDGAVDRVDEPLGFVVAAYDAPVGGRLMAWFRHDEAGDASLEVVRAVEGEPTQTLVSRPLPVPMEVAVRTDAVHCAAGRCLMSEAEDGLLRFRWLDTASGDLGAAVAAVDYGRRPSVWALTPDAGTVTVLLADPPERVDVDLVTGAERRVGTGCDVPLAAAYGPAGKLYVAAVTFGSVEPYRVSILGPDGVEEPVESSVNLHYAGLFPSPERDRLAVGVNAFGTDVYWLDL